MLLNNGPEFLKYCSVILSQWKPKKLKMVFKKQQQQDPLTL